MKQAVILAAGRGTRLRSEFRERPKGFLQLGGQPIVEESLLRLYAAGIERAIIVTGHLPEDYQALAERHGPRVCTVHNERYADSGSLYSLYCARAAVDGDFLLLESDLIYEPRALQVLLDHPAADAILLSGPTGAGDEVYVSTRNGCLDAMSKNPADLEREPTGELVGISKISAALYQLIVDWSEPRFRESLELDYETDGLVAAGADRPIACPRVDDLLWAEIDDPSHLERARSRVYPRLPEPTAPT